MNTPIRGRVIHRAYHDTGALEINCPSCRATVGQFCTRTDASSGETFRRKTPCLARMSLCSPLSNTAEAACVDFSEPRRHD